MNEEPRLYPIYSLHRFLEKNPQWGWHAVIQKYGTEIAMKKTLLLADAEKVHTLLQSRVHTQFRSKAYKAAAKQIPGAPGILFQEGKEWQDRLAQVMPVFTKANLQRYRDNLKSISHDETDKLRERGSSSDFYMDITNLGLKLVLRIGLWKGHQQAGRARIRSSLARL